MNKLTITDLDLKGKTVLIRTDFNVPLDKDKKIIDDTRIVESLPTIQYALKQGAKVIIMSHLGRPNGKVNADFSLAPCAQRLSELLNIPVKMAADCVDVKTNALAARLQPGEVMLLENLRFHSAEEKPAEDKAFAKKLAALADIYINDAFGTAHRAHASTAEIAQYFPGKAAAGLLLIKEINYLGKILRTPQRPFYAIIGGAKISSKLGVIKALLEKVDLLFIGGGMAFTFFLAQGIAIGNSICEKDLVGQAKELLDNPKNKHKIILPKDVVVADKLAGDAKTKIIEIHEGIPQGFQGVDIGPHSIQEFSDKLQDAATVLWNGPLGVFEIPLFAAGTNAIAQVLAELPAEVIIGGGDSAAAIKQTGLENQIAHISTGGGAALEYIELGRLPGIEALTDVAVSNV